MNLPTQHYEALRPVVEQHLEHPILTVPSPASLSILHVSSLHTFNSVCRELSGFQNSYTCAFGQSALHEPPVIVNELLCGEQRPYTLGHRKSRLRRSVS